MNCFVCWPIKSFTSISEQSPEVSFHGLLPSMQDEPDAISSIQDSIQANSNVHEHDPISSNQHNSMQDEPDAISSIQDSIQANSKVHEHDPINDPTFKSVGGEADGGEIFDNDSQSSTLSSIRDMLIGWQNDEATDLRKENILRAGALV